MTSLPGAGDAAGAASPVKNGVEFCYCADPPFGLLSGMAFAER
jgi:hypothetical protein